MDGASEQQATNWVAVLRGFLGTQPSAVERCELCNAPIAPRHAHLLEPESRRLLCSCPACALLFANGEASRYRRVPSEVTRLHEFNLSDAQWDAFLIPINMAFFFRSAPRAHVLAMYPGPAGATDSTLELEAWDDLVEANPLLRELQDQNKRLKVQ